METTVPATVTLKVTAGELRGKEFSFAERTTCVLGRASDCSPRLPDNGNHRTISRHHCMLDINPPDIRIRDFGSLNGTYVNGVKIGQREAHQTPEDAAAVVFPEHDLSEGDEISLGETVFRVCVEQPESPAESFRECVNCGRPVSNEAGSRAGDYLCATCQAEPEVIVKRLLRQAGNGNRDLAAIAGYTLLRELGRGGMGAVYLARHDGTGEQVALKVMLPKAAASSEARARFLREAEVTKVLRHRNIAALFDAGSARGSFFFTIEYCAGGSLDRLAAAQDGRLPIDVALPLTLQALDGLEHAHNRGIVHRDLSPHNILLGWDGGAPVAKVCDFGLAKAFDQAGLSGLTRTGTAAGKPWFMPRQQIINFKHSKPEVDVWALVACLYWMLTSQVPRDFPARKDPWQVVLQTQPVPIRQRDRAIPPALAEVIDEALRDQPTIAFPDAATLRHALQRAMT